MHKVLKVLAKKNQDQQQHKYPTWFPYRWLKMKHRMQSHHGGVWGKIKCTGWSGKTYKTYKTERRGRLNELKGMGEARTYYISELISVHCLSDMWDARESMMSNSSGWLSDRRLGSLDTLVNWWTIICRQCFFISRAWVLSAASKICKTFSTVTFISRFCLQ